MQNKTPTVETYTETDLYAAAALMTKLDLPLLRTEPNGGRRCAFVLPAHPEIAATREAYFARKLSVDALEFSCVLREVKRRLHAEGSG